MHICIKPFWNRHTLFKSTFIMAANEANNMPTETPVNPPEASEPLDAVHAGHNLSGISSEPVPFTEECDGAQCSHMRPWSSELNIPLNLPIADTQLQYKKINSEHSFRVGVLNAKPTDFSSISFRCSYCHSALN